MKPILFFCLSTHLNVFGLCNLEDIFPVGPFRYEAILDGDADITRDLQIVGIPYISFSLALESRFVNVIYKSDFFSSVAQWDDFGLCNLSDSFSCRPIPS